MEDKYFDDLDPSIDGYDSYRLILAKEGNQNEAFSYPLNSFISSVLKSGKSSVDGVDGVRIDEAYFDDFLKIEGLANLFNVSSPNIFFREIKIGNLSIKGYRDYSPSEQFKLVAKNLSSDREIMAITDPIDTSYKSHKGTCVTTKNTTNMVASTSSQTFVNLNLNSAPVFIGNFVQNSPWEKTSLISNGDSFLCSHPGLFFISVRLTFSNISMTEGSFFYAPIIKPYIGSNQNIHNDAGRMVVIHENGGDTFDYCFCYVSFFNNVDVPEKMLSIWPEPTGSTIFSAWVSSTISVAKIRSV